MIKQATNQKGFTLVEITIAMAVFGSVLVIISVTLFGIIKIYRSSVAQRDTQNNASFAIENVVRDTRLADSAIRRDDGGAAPDLDSFCLKVDQSKWFLYFTDDNANGVKTLYRRTLSAVGACSTTPTRNASDQVLTADTVQVLELDVEDTSVGAAKIGIAITLTVGSKSGIVSGGAVCQTGPGSEFCSVTKLETSVTFRGGGS